MTENLLTPSVIKLFGRQLNDILFQYDQNTVVRGYNNLLQRQLGQAPPYPPPVALTGDTTQIDQGPPEVLSDTVTNVQLSTSGLIPGMTVQGQSGGNNVFEDNTVITRIIGPSSFVVSPAPIIDDTDIDITATYDQTPLFARIYGFSFEGTYYGLPRPSIYLVHGPGTPAGNWLTNSTIEQAGVAAREWDFSGNRFQDIRYWEYEKGDFSIRLDPEAGPFEQILLAAALRAGADMADRATPRSGSGLDTRSGSGLDTRSGSGLDTRSGSGLRR
jgi:hypothetical protein